MRSSSISRTRSRPTRRPRRARRWPRRWRPAAMAAARGSCGSTGSTPNGGAPMPRRVARHGLRCGPAAQGREPRRSSTRLPKSPADLPIWAMMETPLGMLERRRPSRRMPGWRASSWAPTTWPRNWRPLRPDRLPLMTALGLCLLAAQAPWLRHRRRGLQRLQGRGRAARRMRAGPRHGVRRQDADPPRAGRRRQRGLRARRRTRSTSPGARSPPSRRPRRKGQGVAVVDGKIVENLHVDTARKMLAKPRRSRQIAAE